MAETEGGQEKTEEATQERRMEFRSKGQIAISREISSVLVLVSGVTLLAFLVPIAIEDLFKLFKTMFFRVRDFRISLSNIGAFASFSWMAWFSLILPIFCISIAIAVLTTFFQTKLNWSWEKLEPDFKRLNPINGLKQMVGSQVLLNAFKGIGKMISIGMVSYLILMNEWSFTPLLMRFSAIDVFSYWGEITVKLVWAVGALLLIIAAIDYGYNFRQIESQLKMSKEELKEDLKKQEVDPHVKSRMKKMQRDIVFAKNIQATKTATVVITNPTHFAIALKYEWGMQAPIVVAKGMDQMALHMRAVAKDAGVSIVENKPLARLLYRVCDVGQVIPENLYKAVSEIIRYVFKLKGQPIKKPKPMNRR